MSVQVVTYTKPEDDNRNANLEVLINEVVKFDEDIELTKSKRDAKVDEIREHYPELFQGSECEAVTKHYRTNFKRTVTNRFDGKKLFEMFDTAIRDGKLTALPSYLKLSVDRDKLKDVCTAMSDYDPKLGLVKHKGWNAIMRHCKTSVAKHVKVEIKAVIGEK